MLHRNLAYRIVAPTIFVSLLLLSLCIAAAVYLYHQQAESAKELGENVDSRRIAHQLTGAVAQWSAALKSGDSAKANQWRESVRQLLGQAWTYADKEEEQKIVSELKDRFAGYPETPAADRLDREMMPLCQELRDFNSVQIESSEQIHRQTFPWLAWGLAVVGAVGSIAGLVLGYGVAKGLSHSIYQLSVRVRDAADKLGQDLPTVTLQEDGDLSHLHEQIQGMVHEIEQVVDRLQQREREVLRAEQLAAVGQIAAGVAHELRNPLTSIKLLVQTSREESEARASAVADGDHFPRTSSSSMAEPLASNASSLSPADLDIIQHEIRRMERCLQSFLDFARPPKSERKPLPLGTVVDRTLDLIGGRARKQAVEIQATVPNQPLTVLADAEQLQQVLVNLTLNSLDAMPRGGKLTIQVAESRRAGFPGHEPKTGDFGNQEYVELRVTDTGPGIAPQIAPRLFEPFVSGKETGLGLGLVISRRIVEDHGGTRTATNGGENGACFVLRLPLRSC